jgi:glycosyltransferase involved in cell wall biosynthesis
VAAPKISVCIPVKNGGPFLPLAVESVLSQARDDTELVIVDNCSTDGTAQWIEKKAANTACIRFYKNPVDIGMTANFNACLKHAAGEYVTFLCADDLLLPQSLERMSRALDGNAKVALVVGGRRLIDEAGAKLAMRNYANRDITVPGKQVINRCLFGGNDIGEPSAVMFRRKIAKRGFHEQLSQLMDLEMWFYLLEQGDMANLADEVCAIRRHPGQLTKESINTGTLIDENVALFEAYGVKPYVRKTFFNTAMRKARMAYRVWICRDSMTAERRNQILADHSSKLLYYFWVPPMAGLLDFWARLASRGRGN